MFKILGHACVSEKYGVLSMKCFTLISLLNYSSFLRFITVVFVTWERLGLINFLLHIAYWFHLWLFNIVHAQYGFFLKICFFLGQIDNLSFAQNGQIIKPVLKFKFWRHACVNAEYVVFFNETVHIHSVAFHPWFLVSIRKTMFNKLSSSSC